MNFFLSKNKRNRSSDQKGFTLIEMLVVVAIFIFITGAVLIRQTRFSSDIAITNLAYQIGLTVRQAQVYGLSVRGSNNGGVTDFDAGYGVHFDSSAPTSFKFFSDVTPKDGLYVSGTDSLIQDYNLAKGSTITDVCANISGVNYCYSKAKATKITSLDVVFNRPNPNAIMTAISFGGSPIGPASKSVVTLTSPTKDKLKCIIIYDTGQISVADPVTGVCQ